MLAKLVTVLDDTRDPSRRNINVFVSYSRNDGGRLEGNSLLG